MSHIIHNISDFHKKSDEESVRNWLVVGKDCDTNRWKAFPGYPRRPGESRGPAFARTPASAEMTITTLESGASPV